MIDTKNLRTLAEAAQKYHFNNHRVADFQRSMRPSDVLGLLDALERKDAALLCAERILAWVCFGDRRALDDGPVLTATDAYNAITKELTP